MPQPQSSPPQLLVLTGFLGSGKTTVLNRLLRHPSLTDTAVVINEFGEIGIDHLLVTPVADDVVLLESGCVCCSAGEDLGSALASLLARRRAGELPPFRRIVLETTGIADPSALLQRILADATLAATVRIHGVLTVADAVFGEATLERHPECALQAAVANRLVLSKLDLVASATAEALVAKLRSINPSAPITAACSPEIDPAMLFAEGRGVGGLSFGAAPPRASGAAATAHARHTDRYASFCLRWDEPLAWNDLAAWLEALLIARGDSILRMKGLLHVEGRTRPLVVQGVQHALYPPTELSAWPQDTARSELVFITRDFSGPAALRSLQQCFPQGPRFTVSAS
jgi:G3E family GTPase